jgi:hypothetical protein
VFLLILYPLIEILVGKAKKRDLENEAVNEGTVKKTPEEWGFEVGRRLHGFGIVSSGSLNVI